jgi:hypothetical protein
MHIREPVHRSPALRTKVEAGESASVSGCRAEALARRKRKRSQNPKKPLLFSEPSGYNFFENARQKTRKFRVY